MTRSELEKLVHDLGAFTAACIYYEQTVLVRLATNAQGA